MGKVRRAVVAISAIAIAGLLAWWFLGWPLRVPTGDLRIDVPANDQVILFAVGDTGTGDDNARAVFAAMEARCQVARPDGVLLLGDNFYKGGVTGASDEGWQTGFFSMIASPCLAGLDYYPILGNHDYRGSVRAQIERSATESRWHMPHRYYEVAFGDLLQVTAFDSIIPDLCLAQRFCAVDFLLHALERSEFSWRFTMAHHPLASSDARPGRDRSLYGDVMERLLCNRVDLYLSGHAHLLERRRPDGCRLEALISGGGGGVLHSLVTDPSPEVHFARSVHGFVEIVATRGKLDGAFIDTRGTTLHAWRTAHQPAL